MFIIKGVNIFPMQVEKVLVQFPELGSNYLITLETISNQDEMIVEVELSDLSNRQLYRNWRKYAKPFPAD